MFAKHLLNCIYKTFICRIKNEKDLQVPKFACLETLCGDKLFEGELGAAAGLTVKLTANVRRKRLTLESFF